MVWEMNGLVTNAEMDFFKEISTAMVWWWMLVIIITMCWPWSGSGSVCYHILVITSYHMSHTQPALSLADQSHHLSSDWLHLTGTWHLGLYDLKKQKYLVVSDKPCHWKDGCKYCKYCKYQNPAIVHHSQSSIPASVQCSSHQSIKQVSSKVNTVFNYINQNSSKCSK